MKSDFWLHSPRKMPPDRPLLGHLLCFIFIYFVATISPARAADAIYESPRVSVQLVAEHLPLARGKTAWIGLHLKLAPGWHTYWKNPGDSGMPLSAEWRAPKDFPKPSLVWPFPERIETPPLATYGFSDELILPFQWEVPERTPANFTLEGKFAFLVCKEVCVPETATLILPISFASDSGEKLRVWEKLFEQSRDRMPEAAKPESFRVDRNRSALTVHILDKGLLPGGDAFTMEFFPDAEGWLATGAPRRLIREGTGAPYLELQLSDNAPEAPRLPSGVVVLSSKEYGSKAYQVGAATAPLLSANEEKSVPKTPNPEFSWSAVIFALLGGLLLNLMPCVFPVLAIKVLSFLSHGGGERNQKAKIHGLTYAAGVISTFLLLGTILALLRAAGEQLGWGFQLQSPLFLALLIILLFVLGLNFLGLFEFSGRWMGIGERWTRGNALSASFATGALAVVVATPCSAPFMGTAIGIAMLHSWPVMLLIFFSLGFGMALPYVVLVSQPRLLALLPKPGTWMVTLKEFLAFPLFGTAIWLLWVFSLVAGADATAMILASLTIFSLGFWCSRRLQNSRARNLVFSGCILLGLASAAQATRWATSQSNGSIAVTGVWEKYSESRLADLRRTRPVFIDFTAAWCITCKVNERVAIERPEVMEAFRKRNVALLKADWTQQDPEIAATLERYGRVGVPLYLLFMPGKEEPEILPQVLSPSIILTALERIPGSISANTSTDALSY